MNSFLKRSIRQFFSYYQNGRKSTFLPFAKNLYDRFNYLFLYMIIFLAMEILKFWGGVLRLVFEKKAFEMSSFQSPL